MVQIKVGTVRSLKGNFEAVDREGNVRTLKINDPIYEGDEVRHAKLENIEVLKNAADSPKDQINIEPVDLQDEFIVIQDYQTGETYSISYEGYLYFEPQVIGEGFENLSSSMELYSEKEKSSSAKDETPDEDPTEETVIAADADFINNPFDQPIVEADSGEIFTPEEPDVVTPLFPPEEPLSGFDEIDTLPVNEPPVPTRVAIDVFEESKGNSIDLAQPFDPDEDSTYISITELPTIGVVKLPDGTPLQVGDAVSITDLTKLIYDAPQDYLISEDPGELTYSISDGEYTAFGTIEINVIPVNDPTIAFDTEIVVNEESNDNPTDIPLPFDIDGDLLSITVTEIPSLGTLFGPDGQAIVVGSEIPFSDLPRLTYDGPEDFDPSVDPGDLVYVVTDGEYFATGKLDINIIPVNDSPTIALDTGDLDNGSVTEVSDFSAVEDVFVHETSGTLTLNDTDVGDVHRISISPKSEDYLGEISIKQTPGELINEEGNLTWEFTVKDTEIDFLAQGETRIQEYLVQAEDEAGEVVTQTVFVTIKGTNDNPVIFLEGQNKATGAILEIQDLASAENQIDLITTGTLSFTDTDLADSHIVSIAPKGENYLGEIEIAIADDSTGDGTGALNWEFKVPDSQIDYLTEGETKIQTYLVELDDGNGGIATQEITITITGKNEGPIAIADFNTVTEDEPAITGTVLANDSDVDGLTIVVNSINGDPAKVGNLFSGDYGDMTLNADGSYTYSLDNGNPLVQQLAIGETLTDTFSYTIIDPDGATSESSLTLTINGTNDAPDISITTGDSVTETINELPDLAAGENISDVSTAGTISFSDVDLSDTHTVEIAADNTGYLGEISVLKTDDSTSDGTGSLSWEFSVPDADLDFLVEGETLTQTYTITLTDENGAVDTQQITITIIGKNEGPIAIADSNTVTEDGPAITGTVLANDSDVDGPTIVVSTINGDPAKVGNLFSGDYGDLTLNADGSYTYGLDNSNPLVQQLAIGETLTDTFTYSIIDPDGATSESTLTIVVNSANDAPVISVLAGDSASEIVTEIADLAVNENIADLTTSGTLTFEDIDLSDAHTVSVVADNSDYLGTMTVAKNDDSTGDGTGSLAWEFSVNDADIDYLAEGETKIQTYTVSVDDARGGVATETVTVTLTGTNDAPEISINALSGDSAVGAVTELLDGDPGENSSDLTDSGTLTFTDVDLSDTHTVSVVADGAGYKGVLNAAKADDSTGDGTGQINWEFTVPDADIDGLKPGETLVQTYTVSVADGNGGISTETVSITITGTNDKPIIDLDADDSSGAAANDYQTSYTENAASIAIADIDSVITDVDHADNMQSAKVVLTNTFAGDSLDISGVDGKFGAIISTVGDETIISLTGDFSYADYLDAIKAIRFVTTSEDPDTTDRVIEITVNDGFDNSAKAITTIEINRQNDSPVTSVEAGDSLTGAVTELTDGTIGENIDDLTDSGTISFSELDLDDTHTVSVTPAAGGYKGTLTAVVTDDSISDGSGQIEWTFSVADADIDFLKPGETLTQDYTVTVDDGNGGTSDQTVTITLTGTNDKPVIDLDADNSSGSSGSDYQLSFTENDAAIAIADSDSQITDADHENIQSAKIVLANTQSGDSFDISAVDGKFGAAISTVGDDTIVTLTGDFSVADYQDAIESIKFINTSEYPQTDDRVIEIIVNDGTDDSAVATTTIEVTSVNDTPTTSVEIGDSLSGSVTEIVDGGVGENVNDLTDSGTFSFADVDFNDSHTVSVTPVGGGYLGTLTAAVADASTGDGTGSIEWSFTVSDADVDYLQQGETLTQNYTVTVDDGNGGTSSKTVTVAINGTNDVPVIDLDADNSSGSSNNDYQITFTEGDSAIAIADGDRLITDSDHSNIQSATITLTNTKPGDSLNIAGVDVKFGAAINTVGDDTIVTLTGDFSIADYQDAISSIKFINSSEDPDSTDRVIRVTVNDGLADSDVATTTVNLIPVNDVPTVSDVSVEVDKDGSVAITLNGSDVDSTISHFRVTGFSPNGTLYKDAGCTQAVNLNEDMAAAGNSLTLYFKPTWAAVDGGEPFGPSWFDPANPDATFTFQAKDADPSDGVTYSANGTATVTIDDVPYTFQGADKTVVENYGGSNARSVGGNLLTDGADFASGKDYQGADNPANVYQVRYTDTGDVVQTKLLTAGTNEGGGNYSFDTKYGKLIVHADGSYTFIPDGSISHPVGADITETFAYTIIDQDGDISNFSDQNIIIQDGEAPAIGTPVNSTVDEANLDGGTAENIPLTTVTETLDVSTGTDGFDVKFDGTQTAIDALIALGLSSNDKTLSYSVSGDGHTLTATRAVDGATVFTVTITNPTNTSAGYEFVLAEPLDHEPAVSIGEDINLDFAVTIADDDHAAIDKASDTFRITIVDDDPANQAINLDEDANVTFNTNADATGTNTSILVDGDYGTAIVNADGTITYASDSDYSGSDTFTYRTVLDDGTTKDTVVTATVNPLSDGAGVGDGVGPNSNILVTTSEDVQISLNTDPDWKLPTVTDNIDDNGLGANGDQPERIGFLELESFDSGAKLYKADGTTLVATGDGSTLKFFITDAVDFHTQDAIDGQNGPGVIKLTTAEFEGLKVVQDSHKGNDLDFTLRVTEYEVDDSNYILEPTNKTETTQTIHVEVESVTDDITASFTTVDPGTGTPGLIAGNEDSWIRIDNALDFTPVDTDGSETYTLKFSDADYPAGTQFRIGSGAAQSGAGGFSHTFTTSSIPQIYIRTPGHDSGDIDNLTVTLELLDTDSDSGHTPATISTDLTINVDVDPVANDISASGGGQGNEDTQINLGINYTNNDPGSESVVKAVISGVPDGGKLYKADGTLLFTGDGVSTYDTSTDGLTQSDIEGLKILPPQDDNTDFSLTITTHTQDVDEGGGQATATNNFDTIVQIKVSGIVDTSDATGPNPWDESAQELADNGNLYVEINNLAVDGDPGDETVFANMDEDSLIDLGMTFESFEARDHATGGANLASESAVFLIRNQTGDSTGFSIVDNLGNLIGQQTSDGWKLTQTELGQAHLKTQQNWSGEINLELVTTVSDKGDDAVADINTQIDKFQITIDPVSDEPTIMVTDVFTSEDNAVALDLRPYTGDIDGSEDPTQVVVADIPSGAAIKLSDGTNIFVNNTPGTASYTFWVIGFTSTGKSSGSGDTWGFISEADLGDLFITPPAHQSGDFVLKVTPTVDDGSDASNTADAPIDVTIHIQGVADTPQITLSDGANADASVGIMVDGVDIVDASTSWNGFDSIEIYGLERTTGNGIEGVPLVFEGATGENEVLSISTSPGYNSAKAAGDVSETITYILEGLPQEMKLVDAAGNQVGYFIEASGGKITWSFSGAELAAGILIQTPIGYSGTVSDLNVSTIVTENDGDFTVLDMPFTLTVNPVVGSTDPIADVIGVEDATTPGGADKGTLIDLVFDDLIDSTGSETITQVTIQKAGLPNGLELWVKSGGVWKQAEGFGVVDKETYYDFSSYVNEAAVGVIPGGSLAHVHVTDGSLDITGVSVTVQDGSENGNPATTSQVFNGAIDVTLNPVVDAPVIDSFTGSFDDPGTGNVMSLTIDTTFADSDGSETQYYIIELPDSNWALNKGTANGDNTWYLDPADIAGLKMYVPEGTANATVELTAYSVEDGVATDTATLTGITDPGVGGPGLGGE